MKKTFLAAIAIIIAFAFTACEKTEKTTEDLLTQKKGWVLYSGASIPAYESEHNGTGSNLLEVFFLECELDDIIYFNANKAMMLNYGKDRCSYSIEGQKEESLGNWALLKNDKVLKFYLAAYYDEENNQYFPLEAEIVSLDNNTMTLRVPIEEDDMEDIVKNFRGKKSIEGAKTIRNYEFILTYKVAK